MLASKIRYITWVHLWGTNGAGAAENHHLCALSSKNFGLEDIGKIKLFESVYPEPVENALLAMLPCFIKDPSNAPKKPFAIPWVYSFSDDLFSEAPHAPDPSFLS